MAAATNTVVFETLTEEGLLSTIGGSTASTATWEWTLTFVTDHGHSAQSLVSNHGFGFVMPLQSDRPV